MTNRTQIVSSAAQRIALKEVAAKLPEWIESMNPASRKAYLKQHPDSKYAAQLQQAQGSGDKVADKHNETIKQAAAEAKAVRAQIKSLKEQLPDPIETRADKAKATRINNKIAGLMTTLQEHKATALKAKTLLEKRQAKKAEPAPEPVVTKPTPKGQSKEDAPAPTPKSPSGVRPSKATMRRNANKPKAETIPKDPSFKTAAAEKIRAAEKGNSSSRNSSDIDAFLKEVIAPAGSTKITERRADLKKNAKLIILRHGIDSKEAYDAIGKLRDDYSIPHGGKEAEKQLPDAEREAIRRDAELIKKETPYIKVADYAKTPTPKLVAEEKRLTTILGYKSTTAPIKRRIESCILQIQQELESRKSKRRAE